MTSSSTSQAPVAAPWVSASHVSFARTVTFSCAHRYFNSSLSEDENRLMYGDLYRADGFGHNFLLEAHFAGPIDPMTGMIVNLMNVDAWLKNIAMVFDHQHLNRLAHFKGVSPTPERIAKAFYEELQRRVAAHSKSLTLIKVRLHEGDDLWVDYGIG